MMQVMHLFLFGGLDEWALNTLLGGIGYYCHDIDIAPGGPDLTTDGH